jgi:two-component system OmpR family response regulator
MGRILLVDDNEALISLYTRMLASEGHIIRSSLSGRECLEELSVFQPDLILLDIMMEPMDGWEVLEKIRGNPMTQHIPVITLSAKFPQPHEMRIYSYQIDDYLLKPVIRKTLCDAVNDFFVFRAELDRIAAKCRSSDLPPGICDEYIENARFLHVMQRLESITEPDISIDLPGSEMKRKRMLEIEKIFKEQGVI